MVFLPLFFHGLLLLLYSGEVKASTCTAQEQNAFATTRTSFPSIFFSCFALNPLTVGDCYNTNTFSVSPCVSLSCVQQSADCLVSNSCSECNNQMSPACLSCAELNCLQPLRTCTNLPTLSFTCDFFCQQPEWMFPLVIALSIVGGLVLLLCLFCACRQYRLRKSDQFSEEPFVPAQTNLLEKQQQQRDRSGTYGLYKKTNILSTKRKGGVNDAPNDNNNDDEFSSVNPVFAHESNHAASPNPNRNSLARIKERISDSFDRVSLSLKGNNNTDHNVRVSKLPESFRKSIQVGLTPDMIFDMETASSMKKANNEAPALPSRVIQSHKFAKMMGVNEDELNKPYSEPVRDRVERLAKVNNKIGYNVGGSTAQLGPEIAQQFTLNQKARKEREEAQRAEEEKIREEIRLQNQEEKQETLRKSMGKKKGGDGKNKLAAFLEENKSPV